MITYTLNIKTVTFIFALIFGQLFTSCNQKPKQEKQKVITKSFTFSEQVEDVDFPPDGLTSNFKSVHEWLIKICNANQPTKPIQTYEIGLFESPKEYTVYLIGVNSYTKKQFIDTRIEFKPSAMYFLLPKSYYKNLNRNQIVDKLNFQLTNFTTTKKFKSSFLAKANTIKTNFKGYIWKNTSYSQKD